MREFNYIQLKNKLWDTEIISYLSQLHEYKGKQEFFLKQKPDELEKLVEIAKIQSTEASNAIEGIRTTSSRLKQLCMDKSTPRNRDEQEIAGYRDALNLIHESFEYIPLTPNYILQLHKILFSHQSSGIGGHYKFTQNFITATNINGESYTLFTPIPPYQTEDAIQKICEQFNKAIAENNIDPLLLIPIFIHDFLCIHPFTDGNGRMSRLLTTLLLYRHGYLIGKFISLESKIAKNKDLYYYSLEQAQEGWHENTDTPESFIKYLLGTILSAYRDLEDRYNLISIKTNSIDIVKKAINSIIGKFTKTKIYELCPSLSISTIENALRKLVSTNEITKHNKGKNTFYTRND